MPPLGDEERLIQLAVRARGMKGLLNGSIQWIRVGISH
jgi:hypothetical protein